MVGNESWIYQGRQEHGWFGHGTSPETDRAMNPDAAPESLAERARYISHPAIAHFPASRRREYELRLDASLERLARIMPIWS